MIYRETPSGEGVSVNPRGGPLDDLLVEGLLFGHHRVHCRRVQPLEIELSGLEIKKYPNCYATHRATDAVLIMRKEGRINISNIKAVHVTSNAGAHAPLVHNSPNTGTEARFSMEYAVAAALLDGRLGLASFNDTQVVRADIRALTPLISASEADGPTFPRWTHVRITHNDESVVDHTVTNVSGGASSPMSLEELHLKVEDCFSFASCPIDAGRFIELCEAGGDTWIHDLLMLLHTPAPSKVL